MFDKIENKKVIPYNIMFALLLVKIVALLIYKAKKEGYKKQIKKVRSKNKRNRKVKRKTKRKVTRKVKRRRRRVKK